MSPSDVDLEIARAEALGFLLGVVDGVILQLEDPKTDEIVRAIVFLQGARDAYNKAAKALLDARLLQ
jgi:hypothetical protein